MLDNLEPAIVHEPAPQKLEIFKQVECGHPSCSVCIPGHVWYVVDKPAGMIVAKCQSWAHALEYAGMFLAAADQGMKFTQDLRSRAEVSA